MAGKRGASRPATKATQPTPPEARIIESPSAGGIGPAGYPPANAPGVNPTPPTAHMPSGAIVTHISEPSAWPTTAPVLGGFPPGAPASGGNPLFDNSHPAIDYMGLAYPPDTSEMGSGGGVDWDDPAGRGSVPDSTHIQTPAALPSAQLPPAGQVTLPSGSVPQATAMEPAGEVPFRPANTTEQGR